MLAAKAEVVRKSLAVRHTGSSPVPGTILSNSQGNIMSEISLDSIVGTTVESVKIGETEMGDIHSIEIKFSNGEMIDIYPTNYNYGPQHLNVDFSG